jgi:hypothetical protein
VTGFRYNKTPGKDSRVLDSQAISVNESRDEDSLSSTTIPTRGIARIARLSRLSRTTRVLYKTRSSPIR